MHIPRFLKRLWTYLKKYKTKFFIATILRIIGDLSNLVPAWALSRIIYLLSQDTNPADLNQQIAKYIIFWLITAVARPIFKFPAKLMGYRIAENAGYDAKIDGLTHIYKLDSAWQEKENSGNKLKRINHGAQGISDIIKNYFGSILESIINTVGIFFIVLTQDVMIALILLTFMIIYYILSVILTRKAANQTRKVNKIEEDFEGLSFESLNNIRTIKALGLNKNIVKLLNKTLKIARKEVNKMVLYYQGRGASLGTFYRLFEVAMVVIIVLQVLNGNYEISLLILFLGYLSKVENAIDEMSEITHELIISAIYISRMDAILETKPTIETGASQLDMPSDWKTINVKNLTFSYGNNPVLSDINIEVKRGEKIGIVGISGAGKSTLFNILLDLYEDYEGTVSIDDISLKKISRDQYIKHVATVLQDTELFNTSLKENILIAATKKESREETQTRLQKAIDTACLDNLLAKLPNGIDTIVGEKGIKLSGGERQRVGIARAIFREPHILLLDEATSHLDVSSERQIQKVLEDFFQDVTAIVIAHRLTTIKNMDRIIVMKEGKIVEQGKFEDLLTKKGHFAELWEKMNQGRETGI